MIDPDTLQLSSAALDAYAFMLVIALVCAWKLRSMRAEMSQMTANSLKEMKAIQKQFDETVEALQKQHNQDLEILQEAKSVIWFRVGAAADQACPKCGWKQEQPKRPSSFAN